MNKLTIAHNGTNDVGIFLNDEQLKLVADLKLEMLPDQLPKAVMTFDLQPLVSVCDEANLECDMLKTFSTANLLVLMKVIRKELDARQDLIDNKIKASDTISTEQASEIKELKEGIDDDLFDAGIEVK